MLRRNKKRFYYVHMETCYISPIAALRIVLGFVALEVFQPLPAERHHLEENGQEYYCKEGQKKAEEQLHRHLRPRLVHFRLRRVLIGLIFPTLLGGSFGEARSPDSRGDNSTFTFLRPDPSIPHFYPDTHFINYFLPRFYL